jgi:serine/threonine protein kinase
MHLACNDTHVCIHQVRLAVHKLSGRRVAVKVIDKTKLADAAEARRIQREIRVMRHLSHECIIKLLEVSAVGSSTAVLY